MAQCRHRIASKAPASLARLLISSSSPFAPRFKGTMKLAEEISEAVNQLCDETGPVQREQEIEDPHLHLNESKAPSPDSLKRSIVEDSCWNADDWTKVMEEEQNTPELNVSVLPDLAHQPGDESVWEDEIIVRFNFALGSLEEVARLEPQSVTVSSSRGEQKCLESPDSVAILPTKHVLMVSEPERDRIGIYHLKSLEFLGWFLYPSNGSDKTSKTSFVKPTSLLAMDNTLVIVDRDEIFVFSVEKQICSLVFRKRGSFHGLCLGRSKWEFFSISKDAQKTLLVCFSSSSEGRNWVMTRKIVIAKNEKSTNIKFLTRVNNKVFVTDRGSHHMILIDLENQETREGGYYGHEAGQICQPADLLPDDVGNVLVCDSGNSRLVLFSEKMLYIKVRVEHYN